VLAAGAFIYNLQNEETWCELLVDLNIPNKIQPQETSRGGATDGNSHNPMSRSTGGTMSAKSTATATTMTGMTTGGLLAVALAIFFIYSSYIGGVCFPNCFFQPPIILPISESCELRVVKCLLSKIFNSQASCTSPISSDTNLVS